jgi:hypothetical protein
MEQIVDVTVVYEWAAWEGFLIRALLPEAIRLAATPQDTWMGVLDVLPQAANRFLFHLNLSDCRRLPRGRMRLVQELRMRGIDPVNAGCLDIRKRSLQPMLAMHGLRTTSASPEGERGTMVIVKTDHNYGGFSERSLDPVVLSDLQIVPPSSTIETADAYRTMPAEDVPVDWWEDESLAIERFITNSADRIFRIYLAGTHVVVTEARSPEQVKKMRVGITRSDYLCSTTRRSWPSILPDDLYEQFTGAVEIFGLRFGALDVVVDDECRCYVIDVNPTPYWGNEARPALIAHLCSGWR